jgi:cobaltochelatase CobS
MALAQPKYRMNDDMAAGKTLTKSARELFGIDLDWQVPVLAEADDHVPAIDPHYHFDPETTRAILAGFLHNRKVMIHGLHGTGKSSHIEQVAARLNWPLVRINLDGHVSRIDLIGRDIITQKDGQQVTEFFEGILPWAMQRTMALVFDEYDAARPDVMFVIQRVLEAEGKLTLLDQNRVIAPSAGFRLFATANTIGLGDATGLYHGTNPINQGQMDRWNIVVNLEHPTEEQEVRIVLGHVPEFGKDDASRQMVRQMVILAGMTRLGFQNGDISTLMSPRTIINWAQNVMIFGNRDEAFRYSYLNKCDDAEKATIAEYYQRVFDVALPEMVMAV